MLSGVVLCCVFCGISVFLQKKEMARTKSKESVEVARLAALAISTGQPQTFSAPEVSFHTVRNYLRTFQEQSGERISVKRQGGDFVLRHNTVVFTVKEMAEIIDNVAATGDSYFFPATSVNYQTLRVEVSKANSRQGWKVVGVKRGDDDGEKFFEVFKGQPASVGLSGRPVSTVFVPLTDRVLGWCRQLVRKAKPLAEVVVPCSETEILAAKTLINDLNLKLPDGGKMVFREYTKGEKFLGLFVKLENHVDPFEAQLRHEMESGDIEPMI